MGARQLCEPVVGQRSPYQLKAHLSTYHILYQIPVCGNIRARNEAATRPQHTAHGLHEARLKEAALMVAALPPGIREEGMNHVNGAIRDQPLKIGPGVTLDHAQVLEPLPLRSPGGDPAPLPLRLKAKHPALRVLPCQRTQVMRAAKTDLKVNRPLGQERLKCLLVCWPTQWSEHVRQLERRNPRGVDTSVYIAAYKAYPHVP